MPSHILQVGLSQGLWSVLALHLAVLSVGAYLLWCRPKGWAWATTLLCIGELTLLLDVVTIVLANNQDGVGAGWFFLALGITHAGIHAVRSESWIRLRLGPALALVLVVVLVRDVVSFSRNVSSTRIANDMTFDPELAAKTADLLPASMGALQWTLPEHHRYPPEDFVAVLEYLKQAPGDFFLIGDTSILYGLAGKRSILPAGWYHPGVTLPKKGSPEFGSWQEQILTNMESQASNEDGPGRDEVLRIVEEKAGTWIGNWRLRDLPVIKRAVTPRIVERKDFGAFRVIELRPTPASE